MGCAMLTLSGCAMFSSPPRQAELVKVGHWEGRISLKVLRDPPELFSASFEINGRPEDGELTFFSPIGTTLAVARWTPFNAQLMEGAKVKRYDSVEAMMLELTGSKLPLPELLGWLDQDGAELPGWTLKSDNSSSSRRVFAKRQQPLPAVELTLVIDPKR
jgi:outer membrane lipoprotein LolB